MPFDTLILNGTIVDGANTPRYKADLGLTGGRITAIGSLGQAEAAKRIDATGHVITPGFIDMHAHSDVTLLDDPGGESKAHQGVTTEVTGNCGYSPFPAGKGGPKALQDHLGKTLIGRVPWTWNTLDEWADSMHSIGISINVAPQLGNAALQVAAGAIEDRRATADEMDSMKRLAAEAMEMGAFSLSTGLSLAPSGYASTDEVVELCKAVRGYEGAFYVTHARVGNGKHLSAILEAIEIGQRAEIPVQFSHMAITDHRVYGEGPAMIDLVRKPVPLSTSALNRGSSYASTMLMIPPLSMTSPTIPLSSGTRISLTPSPSATFDHSSRLKASCRKSDARSACITLLAVRTTREIRLSMPSPRAMASERSRY